MPFPVSERVIYDNNTLDEVICQLRFPTILRISSSDPADFQDEVRSEYPLFQRVEATGLPSEVLRVVGRDIAFPSHRQYQFADAEKNWQITMTQDFLALTTKKYTKWEDFKAHLERPLSALLKLHQPVFFSRIGLRYRNLINRSVLGLEDKSWAELLKPHIAGELNCPDVGGFIDEAAREVVIRFKDEPARVHLRHGVVRTRAADDQDQAYVIDSDFFTEERTEPINAVKTLDTLNSRSGRLFRWCIEDALHQAMAPKPVEA
jgi:uncharacterized protein (TIGR04255 family)